MDFCIMFSQGKGSTVICFFYSKVCGFFGKIRCMNFLAILNLKKKVGDQNIL